MVQARNIKKLMQIKSETLVIEITLKLKHFKTPSTSKKLSEAVLGVLMPNGPHYKIKVGFDR
jgi:hypothetical protein